VEKIKCYELKQVMHQSDEQFINILNQFWIVTQLQTNVDTIINQCFHTLPNDPKFSYLFYIDESKQNIMNQFSFEVKGMYSYFCTRHHDTCLQSFQLQNDVNFTARLHLEVQIKK